MSSISATPSPTQSSTLLSFKGEKKGLLQFTISGINVSFINAIRRTILADIPALVFNCFPHDKNDATIHVNTTRLNNEVLKQRLSCIPIHISDLSLPYKELIVEINAKNDSENTIDVTTEHFKIKNMTSGKYLQDSAVRKIFPPCPITGDYIVFARLRPKVSTIAPGEELSISAKMSIHTAGEDGTFNVASTCAYKFTPDKLQQDQIWQNKLAEISSEEKADPNIIALLQQNWYNHEGLRYFKRDSFDFKLETNGVYTNENLVQKACNILIEKLQNIHDTIENEGTIEKSISTIPNSVDIKLKNTGYTVGKVIEYMLHKNNYQGAKDKNLTYVGFRKNHPHDDDSVIRIGMADRGDNEGYNELAVANTRLACNDAIQVLSDIMSEFS
jgi:DNA-directed RNA polymerase alpha subunit